MIKYIVNKEKRTVAAVIDFGESQETFKNSESILNHLDAVLNGVDYSNKYWKKYNKMFFPRYMSAKLNVARMMSGMKNMGNNWLVNDW